MKRKAELGMVGLMLVAAIAIISGLVLYTEVDKQVGNVVTTVTIRNYSVTLPACGATCATQTAVELPGQAYQGTPYMQNESGAVTITATNYTFTNGLGADGLTAVLLKTGTTSPYNGSKVNVTYIAEPDGYINSSAGRSIALLIAVFAALAVAVIALVPALRNGVLDLV